MQPKTIFRTGALLAGLAVVTGAMGAHAIKGRVEPKLLETFEIAARYQMYHAIGLIAVSAYFAAISGVPKSSAIAIRLLWAGTLIFCGTLYAIVAGGPKWLGAITPIGGTLQIAGWMILAFCQKSKT